MLAETSHKWTPRARVVRPYATNATLGPFRTRTGPTLGRHNNFSLTFISLDYVWALAHCSASTWTTQGPTMSKLLPTHCLLQLWHPDHDSPHHPHSRTLSARSNSQVFEFRGISHSLPIAPALLFGASCRLQFVRLGRNQHRKGKKGTAIIERIDGFSNRQCSRYFVLRTYGPDYGQAPRLWGRSGSDPTILG